MHANLVHLLVALFGIAFDPLPYPPDLKEWTEVPAPKEGTDEYLRFFLLAHRSRYTWVVSTEDNRVLAKLQTRDRFSGPKPDFALEVKDVNERVRRWANCAARVNDGWLVSYNAGEWGGELWWFSEDGNKRRRIVEYCNIKQFIRTKEGLFLIEGSSHGLANRGTVLRLAEKEGLWAAEKLAKLPAAGCAGTPFADGSLLVVTAPTVVVKNGEAGVSTKIVRVSMEGKVETLLEVADWHLSPSSVVMEESGKFYMGAAQYVVVFDPMSKSDPLKYFVPRKDFLRSRK